MAFEPRAEVFDDIVPHPEGVDPDADLLHERAYVVRSYRTSDGSLLIRGGVRDQKPAGLYLADDPDPLTVHHMVVDLVVQMPTMMITSAKAVLEVHPHAACPRIEDHYGNLVGLSIARGFTHRVRELFGGPRGCTHTTALLQAMAPVAIQSTWSLRIHEARRSGQIATDPFSQGDSRERGMAMNLNTCHIWAEDGDQVASIRRGDPMEVPVWIEHRLEKLGRSIDSWRPNA